MMHRCDVRGVVSFPASITEQLKLLLEEFPVDSDEALTLKLVIENGGSVDGLTHDKLLVWRREIEPLWLYHLRNMQGGSF
jgi:hypothetical protein